MKGFEPIARHILPNVIQERIRLFYRKKASEKIASLVPLKVNDFKNILINDLGIKQNDVVFVHSSIDFLHLSFPFFKVLAILQDVVGSGGTLLFPAYPRIPDFDEAEYLRSGNIFDVNKTPSNMGILTEFVRRQKKAFRSLHPTKSVCAIGPLAEELTFSHHHSPFPYDSCSPFYKIMAYKGVIVGLGVSTCYLSFLHCVDDFLKDEFPVRMYSRQLYEATCINSQRTMTKVKLYAHETRKISQHSIPKFMRKHVSPEICQDFNMHGRNFFRADAEKLFARMKELALKKITIYSRLFYK
jgi:aminoglycoside 3-N-acetyltransferase